MRIAATPLADQTAAVREVEALSAVAEIADFSGWAAVAPALELVVSEVEPLAASFLTVGDDGAAQFRAARGSHLPAVELAREIHSWHGLLGESDPLGPSAVAQLPGRVVSLADVGGSRAVLDDASLLGSYQQIGAIDDTRMLIREGKRLVAAIAVWRALRSKPWTSEQLGLLETLQPLIEVAFLAARRDPSRLEDRLPATLTPRQREVARLLAAGATNREVARALRISPNTVKSHARAVLAKVGVSSQREMMILLRRPAATR